MKAFYFCYLSAFFTLIASATHAQQIHFFYDTTETAVNYGCRINIGFTITSPYAKTVATDGFLMGSVSWKKFDIEVLGGHFEIKDEILVKQGVVVIGRKHEVLPGKPVKLKVKYKPLNIVGEYEIPITYIGTTVASYKPEKAKEGKKGFSILPAIFTFLKSANGKPGHNGNDAPDLKVSPFTVVENNDTLVAAAVLNKATYITDTFYTSPLKGRIKIAADGGNGGDGGNGSGSGKYGGDGGTGGKGGNGGGIQVWDSSIMNRYKGCIILSNAGGNGGYGGHGGTGSKESGSRGITGEKGADGPPVYYVEDY